jgi:hypothetical protein
MTEYKRCSRCAESKPLDQYRVLKSGYLTSHCKACAKVYLDAWRVKNAASQSAIRKQRYAEFRRDATPEEWDEKRRGCRVAYARNVDNQRNARLMRYFGITLAYYTAMNAAQGGVCAICRKPCKSGRQLAVDHDHKTGAVRALLCIPCNNGIGNFQDDPDLLSAAVEYLARH